VINLFSDKYFILLLLFWFSLLLNLIFSLNFENSISRAVGFIRFLILALAFKYCFELKNEFYKNIIIKTWSLILAVVIIDLIFEYITGFNTLGYKSYMPGRLAGFLNQELIIGHYFSAFFLIVAVYIYQKYKSQKILLLTLTFFLIISLLIGERGNFLRVLSMIILFVFIVNKNLWYKKLIFLFSFIIIIFGIMSFNINLKYRFYNQFLEPFIKLDIDYITKNNIYFNIYDKGYSVFKENKLFGVGLKNFRIESQKQKYTNENLSVSKYLNTTHPHQVHLEFLSETGIFGYSSFIIFILFSFYYSIKNYFQKGNFYSLASMLFILMSIAPLIPSGSFFTTYGATFFWLNYGIMISKNK
tara:strand:+ start:72 stop:1145 length:1074 start_codon:yes stop_codon:yes gene_type:complete